MLYRVATRVSDVTISRIVNEVRVLGHDMWRLELQTLAFGKELPLSE
jgi:hypothetical protein